jgi:very-short-patch-repair endonuclease
MRKFWGEEELEFLKKLYEIDGLSLSELAPIFNEKYNRSLESLSVKIGRLKLKHTKEQISKIKSRLNSGDGNGMYGKVSPMKGLCKENSELMRIKSIKTSKTRKQMFKDGLLSTSGENNGMYGKTSWTNGLTKHTDERLLNYGKKISILKKKEWLDKTEEEKQIVITRLNDAMIQVRKPTKIEIKINDFLVSENIKFEKNYLIKNFRVDFYLNEFNLVIECDGDYWHGNPKFYSIDDYDKIQNKNFDRDKRKEKMLVNDNIDFIRFWEDDIKNNFDNVKNLIWERLQKK